MNILEGNIAGQQALTGEASMLVGLTPSIQVGTTETTEPNTPVKVELDEASTKLNPIFNFSIPKGEKGEKGEAGQIKFIVVNELPSEDIDESAIYMKSITDPEEQNTYEEYIHVNGAWEKIGNAKVEVNLEEYQEKDELEQKDLLITYEDETTETLKLVVYK